MALRPRGQALRLAEGLPPRLEAHAPPETRGLARDEVRMLVAYRGGPDIRHASFRDLPALLDPGDVLVLNTSATVPAALRARRADGMELELHLSTPVPKADETRWVVELRRDHMPFRAGRAGETLALPAGARAELLAPYLAGPRLWVAELRLPAPLLPYLAEHGHPVRYRYVPEEVPLADYQTVYATEPGSAEMPSAGRPFSHELVTRLVAGGVVVAPILLHTGVSSLETGEAPYPEWFSVSQSTARLVTATRRWGGRVIAVGTTAVRALETVAGPDGRVEAGEGWTDLVVTPERGVRAVDGLLTGWHEPEASHLLMLEALAGEGLLERSYRAAREHGYLWHEFGDAHLILP
jgi:S-adenosylmethionine:tRNA ribosyltransferase-isomerase